MLDNYQLGKIMKISQDVFKNFEKWLDSKNSKIHPVLIQYKGYIPFDEEFGILREGQDKLPASCIPYPIQQVEEEIKEFVEAIFQNGGGTVSTLEIGMGDFGWTHTLFLEIFDKVTTIEISVDLIQRYLNSNPKSSKSNFINVSSQDQTLRYILDSSYDMIFIDGNHSYYYVKNDYLNFKNLSRKGTIIAFHDIASDKYDAKRFITELENGLIDGINHDVKKIIHSNELGIGYIIVQ